MGGFTVCVHYLMAQSAGFVVVPILNSILPNIRFHTHNSKLRYISQELFGDFSHYLWGTFEFYLAIGVYLFALWIRIYVHYLAQYLYLQVSVDYVSRHTYLLLQYYSGGFAGCCFSIVQAFIVRCLSSKCPNSAHLVCIVLSRNHLQYVPIHCALKYSPWTRLYTGSA